jgi:ABC-type branched-subunit amino acid transport system substrate-binding protein
MLEGALGTIPSGPDESTPEGALRKAFVDKFTEKYSEAPYLFQENVYDAAYVGIAAIELAGTTTDRGAIVSALSRIGAGGEARVGDWPAIRERIRAEGRLSLQGASGPVAFSADSPDRKAPYFMTVFEMRNGSPTRVEVRRVDRP